MSTTNNRLTAEELQKLRQTDFSKKQGFVKAETVLAKEVGEVGTLQIPYILSISTVRRLKQ